MIIKSFHQNLKCNKLDKKWVIHCVILLLIVKLYNKGCKNNELFCILHVQIKCYDNAKMKSIVFLRFVFLLIKMHKKIIITEQSHFINLSTVVLSSKCYLIIASLNISYYDFNFFNFCFSLIIFYNHFSY